MKYKQFLLTHLLYFKATVALVIGIVCMDVFPLQIAISIPLAIGISLYIIFNYILKVKRSKINDILFFCGIMFLGIGLHYFNYNYKTEIATALINEINDKQGFHLVRIDHQPVYKANSIKVPVKLLKSQTIDSNEIDINKDIILYLPKDDSLFNSLKYGNIFQIQSTINHPNKRHYSFEFDYKTWLYRHNKYATGYTNKFEQVGKESSFLYKLYILPKVARDYFERSIDKYVPDSNSNVIAKAILIGVKNDIDAELYNAYADTGTIHILSISGLHFGILIYLLNFVLKRSIKNRKLRMSLTHSISFSYALLTGFSPPVFRSFVMFLAYDIQRLSHSKRSIINVLFFSSFIILLFDTNQLFEIGFQLSYAALLGIILWNRFLSNSVTFSNKTATYFWNIFTTLIAAWIWTMPFTIYYFHQVSFMGMLSNFIVIPLIFVIMCVGFGLLFFSWIPILGSIIGLMLSSLLTIQNSIIAFFSHLPLASIENLYLSTSSLLLILIAFLFLNLFLYDRNRYSFRHFVVAMAMVWLVIAYERFQVQSKETWYLNSSFKYGTIAHYKPNKLYVFSDSIEENTYNFFLHPLELSLGLDSSEVEYQNAMSYSKQSLYSMNMEANPKYYVLSKENKSNWFEAIQTRDSFIILNNTGYYKPKLKDSLKIYNRYFKEF